MPPCGRKLLFLRWHGKNSWQELAGIDGHHVVGREQPGASFTDILHFRQTLQPLLVLLPLERRHVDYLHMLTAPNLPGLHRVDAEFPVAPVAVKPLAVAERLFVLRKFSGVVLGSR